MRSVRHPRRTAGMLAGVLLASAALALPPAYAAVPANDSIRKAVEIGSSALPFKHAVQTREATASRSDGECVGGSSVWYHFVPSATKTLRAVTLGSSYRTMLAVFKGPRASRDLVACNTERGFSAVELKFRLGKEYWIAVSKCCTPAKTGGRAVLRLYEPVALEVTTTIDAVLAGDVSGQLFVEGTTKCTNPSQVYMSVFASQRVGDGVAQGYNESGSRKCDPAGVSWTMPLWSGTGWAFRGDDGRRVSISTDSWANDGFTSDRSSQTGIHLVTVKPNARRR